MKNVALRLLKCITKMSLLQNTFARIHTHTNNCIFTTSAKHFNGSVKQFDNASDSQLIDHSSYAT